ncbi:hypothetical protein GmHk_01G001370 [Glycine max]|nr:hypothetical protein GmHk_01G001370 [Glycine max]
MGKVEEVQEQMKADMEAMKEQMAIMMEAMMSMKKIMEANTVAVAATSTVTKVNLTSPSGINQMNHPTSYMVGKDLGSTGGPHDVRIQNEHAFPPYGLPLNYTPPNVAYTPNENFNNSTPIPIESQQPQTDHAHTHEISHHNLADFESCLGYATEGQAVGGIPLQNALEGPQYHPQLHLLHSTTSKKPHAMAEMGKWRDLAAQVAPPMTEKEMITIIVDTLPVFYYEKWWGTHLQSFADLVFAGKRIEAGLKKGKFNHPTWMDVKTGANEEDENEGETLAMTAIPTWSKFPSVQQCHYSTNISPSPYPPASYPQRPSLNQPQSLSTTLPIKNTTFSKNQNTNQEMNFAAKKPVEFTPILVSYADLLPYLLDNSMVAITPAKVHQLPFLQEYDSNAMCSCHGEAPGHSIEHCRALKRKVQGLIDAGWLKFEENRV